MGVFVGTRELISNEESSLKRLLLTGNVSSFYIDMKNVLTQSIYGNTEILGRYKDSNVYKNRILTIDLSGDNYISEIPFSESLAFFDLTNDGIKEKTSWIQSVDGILALDKNNNGKIDGNSEVFGKNSLDGLDELQKLVDTNHDDIANKDDKLFSKLLIWQDHSRDGISQPSELKSLEQVGIEKIELNVLKINFSFKGPLLHRLGRFTKINGDEGVVFDTILSYDQRITTVDISMIPNYKVHIDSKKLPQLRAYGHVYNTEIAYNTNENLRKLALLMSKDITYTERYFDQFIEEWSGFNALLRTIQQEYKLKSLPIVSETDKQIWILETFVAANVNKYSIEREIINTAKLMKTGENPNVRALFYSSENSYVTKEYENLRDRYGAFFTLQTFYPEIMEGVNYDYSIDEFVIKDLTSFNKNFTAYVNNSKVPLESKFHLANKMHVLQGTFIHFNASQITNDIANDEMKKAMRAIFNGNFTPVVYKAFKCGNKKAYTMYQEKADGLYFKTLPYDFNASSKQNDDSECLVTDWLKLSIVLKTMS